MRIIGSMLGMGQRTTCRQEPFKGSSLFLGRPENLLEQIFPGDHDIVHGRHLYRPDNRDVDVYRFTLPGRGGGRCGMVTVRRRPSPKYPQQS